MEHFRRKHVYHWNLVSVPKQVYSCPHCQYPFDSWARLDQHVMSEHNSYGLYYSEPDYLGKIWQLLSDLKQNFFLDVLLSWIIKSAWTNIDCLFVVCFNWVSHLIFLIFLGVECAEDIDVLALLPCTICNELYHDKISLDKHLWFVLTEYHTWYFLFFQLSNMLRI